MTTYRASASRPEKRPRQAVVDPGSLETYVDMADQCSRRFRNQIAAERLKLATQIRSKVLLPFCRKHQLRMQIQMYGNYFIFPNGEKHDDYELGKLINDPMAASIEKYLNMEFMGDCLFDDYLGMDITQDDISKR